MLALLIVSHIAAFAGGVFFKAWLDKEIAKAKKGLAE